MRRRETTTSIEGGVSFAREEELAEKLKVWIAELSPDSPERERLCEIQRHYTELLHTAQLLTRMGDRLQARLRAANETLAQKNAEIAAYNQQLQEKNRQLQQTLEALQASQRRRKALTVLGFTAISVFIITELIEYYIETTGSQLASRWASFISIGLKALVALAFKPLEDLIQDFLARFVREKPPS
jgi:flagellar biosynthesis chaperone FliJ